MDTRAIALQFNDASLKDNVLALIDGFTNSKVECRLMVFKKDGLDAVSRDGVEEIAVPSIIDNDSKLKNFIFKHMQASQFKGFLHIIDLILLLKDPSTYISKIEQTMDVLDYSIHFSTVTDPCNYLFKKFNPRLTLDIDDEETKAKLHLPDKVSFTSHANTCWTIYDFNKLDGLPPLFDEKFSIAMYLIIEYLARRRATRKEGQLYYMNLYLSISDEVGTFKPFESSNSTLDLLKMQEEDTMFKEMKVDYSPDNNIDSILDAFYVKIKEKLAAIADK